MKISAFHLDRGQAPRTPRSTRHGAPRSAPEVQKHVDDPRTAEAVERHAVGGLEQTLWCDLRIAATDGVFDVFCRRCGAPPLLDLCV
jgi:hypothetical protein